MAANNISIIRSSTQEHLEIEDIIDDITILKDGSCSIVVQITAINFNLLSEGEQDAIIFAYAGLLNSLTFQIQIMIRSNVKDVSDYVNLIKKQEEKLKKPLLLDQLKKYRKFIESIVKENQVLDKNFYIIIPFANFELGLSNPTNLGLKKHILPYPKAYILEKAKMSLYPKRDHLLRQFGRLGLQAQQLNTQQLLELFYNFYNQESVGQKLTNPSEYKNPIVQPAIQQQQTLIYDKP